MRRAGLHNNVGGLAEKIVRIEDDGRGVGLVAINDERIGGRALADDGVGQLFGTEHGLKARKGDVRGDEEDREVSATLMVAARCLPGGAESSLWLGR